MHYSMAKGGVRNVLYLHATYLSHNTNEMNIRESLLTEPQRKKGKVGTHQGTCCVGHVAWDMCIFMKKFCCGDEILSSRHVP